MKYSNIFYFTLNSPTNSTVRHTDRAYRKPDSSYLKQVKLIVGLDVVVTVVGSESLLPFCNALVLNSNLTSLRMFKIFDFIILGFM